MAPSMPAGIIYQALIQSNCQTFLGGNVDVDVVSQLDAAGTTWKVHVLKTEGGKRTAVLSGSASSLQGAFEDLHRKSAQAVDQYVSSNGFDAVSPDPVSPPTKSTRHRSGGGKKGRGKGRGASPSSRKFRRGSSASEVSAWTSASSSSESEASGSDSDSDGSFTASSVSWKAPVRLPKPSRKSKAPELFPTLPMGRPPAYRTLNEAGPGPHVMVPPMPMPKPMPPGMGRPPPLIPGMPGYVRTQWNMGNKVNSNVFQMPPLPVRGPQPSAALSGPTMYKPPSMAQPPPPTLAFKCSVILTISWNGHGETTFFDKCELSQAAIRTKVVDLLSTRSGSFVGTAPWQHTHEALASMDIAVQRVKVDQKMYFVCGGMQDDLSVLLPTAPPARVIQVFVDMDKSHADD